VHDCNEKDLKRRRSWFIGFALLAVVFTLDAIKTHAPLAWVVVAVAGIASLFLLLRMRAPW